MTVDGTQITRPAQSASELSDAQRKAYKYDVLDYQIWDQESEKIKREIRAVDDAVKSSARQHIHQMISSIRQIIRTLTARYKQDSAAIADITLLNEILEKQKNEINTKITPTTELKSSTPTFSFANTVIKDINPLTKSVIYDSGCSDPLTYDKNRFLGQIKPVANRWIETPSGRMKVKDYGTMQVLEKLKDKVIKMKFDYTAYVLTTSMTLVSSTKLIKEGYDRDMHTKTLVHVATEKKICDIEEHFGIMILEYNSIPIQPTEYVEYGATVDPRNEMENMTSNNLTNESTATVKKTAPKINEVLNETPNKKIEMLNNQAPTKEKEVKKTPHSTTISESVSVPINHEKSGTKPIQWS